MKTALAEEDEFDEPSSCDKTKTSVRLLLLDMLSGLFLRLSSINQPVCHNTKSYWDF